MNKSLLTEPLDNTALKIETVKPVLTEIYIKRTNIFSQNLLITQL